MGQMRFSQNTEGAHKAGISAQVSMFQLVPASIWEARLCSFARQGHNLCTDPGLTHLL